MWCLGINCSGHHFIKNMQSLLIILKGMPERNRCKNSHKISFNLEFIWFSVFVTEKSSLMIQSLPKLYFIRSKHYMKHPIYKCHVEWFYLAQLKLQQHYLHVLFFTKSSSHQDKINIFDWTGIYSNPLQRPNWYSQWSVSLSLYCFYFSLTEKYIREHKERLQTGAAPELGPSLLSDLLADPQMSTADIQRTLMDVFVGGIDSASTCFSIKGQTRGYTPTV